MSDSIDFEEFSNQDDSTLLSWRAKTREELEHLPPRSLEHAKLSARYDLSTQEIDDRARRAWTQNK